jgi:hypothetical protein
MIDDTRYGRGLVTQKRRFLRALATDDPVATDPIVHPAEHLDSEQYEEACYELHHVILPELAAVGLVEFDRAADEVTRGPEFGPDWPTLGCNVDSPLRN